MIDEQKCNYTTTYCNCLHYLSRQLLRRHLVHIFQYDFPEHYGEVLQTVLIGCSDQRLLPTVLAELLQAIYQLASCPEPPTFDVLQAALTAENNPTAVGSDARGSGGGEYMTTFAVQQQLFGFKAVQDTLAMLAQHFRTERLQHGLHGLYPKHREYCAVLSVLLRSYGYALVVTAVYAYPGLLADKCEYEYIILDIFSILDTNNIIITIYM